MNRSRNAGRGPYVCSFCNRGQEEVRRLIAGPDRVFICDDCVALCSAIIAEESDQQTQPVRQAALSSLDRLPTPRRIREKLDQYVIGQDHAKTVLSVAVYNHYKRIRAGLNTNEIEIGKSNVLLVGPTGSGKTLLAQTLARLLDVPFAIADATALTEAGYVGEDVENILLRLVQSADGDLARAQIGIIYLDEIDKIGRKGDNPSITRDVSGEGVQQALLKILEGCIAHVPPVPGRKHPQQEYIAFDTSNVLFICGGSFEGISKVRDQRLKQRNSIGYYADLPQNEEPPYQNPRLIHDDVIHFGFIPEFAGRLPVIVELDSPTRETMMRILTEPKNALIRQYQKMLALDHIELDIAPEAIEVIADRALAMKTGARALRSIVEDLLLNVMYEAPSQEHIGRCIITAEVVQGRAQPILVPRSERNDKRRMPEAV